MRIYTFRNHDPAATNAILTIGNFDGVHLGHQALIRRVVEEARAERGISALMTFDPHPQEVLHNRTVPIITGLELRLRLFEGLGLDAVYVIPFTRDLAAKSPEAFVAEYLIARFKVKKLVIGYDFAFGRRRSGTAEVLDRLSRSHGFSFEIFPAVTLHDAVVSSTRIREALARADFAAAARMLGRPYSLLEPVVQGLQRGRLLGFPTANLRSSHVLPIPHGVYVSRVVLRGREFGGVSNFGVKPTMGGTEPTFETLIFEFEGELYGESIEVTPLHRLREERTFPSFEALKAQIAADRDRARTWLAAHPAG